MKVKVSVHKKRMMNLAVIVNKVIIVLIIFQRMKILNLKAVKKVNND